MDRFIPRFDIEMGGAETVEHHRHMTGGSIYTIDDPGKTYSVDLVWSEIRGRGVDGKVLILSLSINGTWSTPPATEEARDILAAVEQR